MASFASPLNRSESQHVPESGGTNRFSFGVMTSLFFVWGFMTVFNDILIPKFKEAFELSYFQAMLVQFAFFGAYFIGSLLYFATSVLSGDPIARIGYKNGVVVGLLISASGSALFYPAAVGESYPLFLLGLFVIGMGFAVLQIAANPYITILGPEETASSRLNLAQAFNSLGTTLGPLVGGWLIFRLFHIEGSHGAEAVKVPYLVFSGIFLVLAGLFFFIRLPKIGGEKVARGAGALRYPHLVLGILAIFMYVGGEVSIGSAIVNFLGQKDVAGLSATEASKFLSFYWGGLMIGRFMGAVSLGDLNTRSKNLLMSVIPLVALAIIILTQGLATAADYCPFLALCWIGFRFAGRKADRTLALFATVVVFLIALAMLFGGRTAMWCVLGIGLFTSIGWSNTFSLAIEGIGDFKSQGSSLLVMAILGGALLPPLQGALADHLGLRLSFVVPMIAYGYLVFYGLWGCRVGKGSRETVPPQKT
jgi:MFS transporter, FHS family, L-fucose permease